MPAPIAALVTADSTVGPRAPSIEHDTTRRRPCVTQTHDPSVTFEAYLYWAVQTRADEAAANQRYIAARGRPTVKSLLKDRFSPSASKSGPISSSSVSSPPGCGAEKSGRDGAASREIDGVISSVTPEEWKQASRALRTAGWGAVFYLITTDILGPFSTPWAFAQMGYGPGVALYTVFGVMSGYSGCLLWKVFLGMDSDRYPLRGYGDLFYRIYGPTARHLVNMAQSIQMLLTVAVLILSNGQSISQISKGQDGSAGICFVACLVIFMCAGFVLGQIRTLQRFSWLANAAVWINLLILLLCMGVAAHSAPNYTATKNSFGDSFDGTTPITTYAGTPPNGMASGGDGFVGSLNGLNQAVYSYGGALIFAAFLAEMRHPHDFWKSLIAAECFIYVVYMFFGIFVYSYQGQYTFNPVMQGLSPYSWQTATNLMNIITGLIAAALYGNIGLKVIYIDVCQELVAFPPLTARRGKILWAAIVPFYWALALVVGAAVPHISSISGLVGALFILSFTYTLPALLGLGYWIKKDAMTAEERYDPATSSYNYVDRGPRRLLRGFMVRPLFNTWNVLYFLGALATTALGCYSSIKSLIDAFNGGSKATSFGCSAPV